MLFFVAAAMAAVFVLASVLVIGAGLALVLMVGGWLVGMIGRTAAD